MTNVKMTRRDARAGTRRVISRTAAPMRAVLKQVSDYSSLGNPPPISTLPMPLPDDPQLERREAIRMGPTTRDEGGPELLEVEFPYGPVDVKYANIALNYAQIKRPGLQPLLVHTAPQLNVVTFTATIADKRTGGKAIIEDTLDILKEMAAEDRDCEFIYGLSALPYRVRITQMDINSRYRNLEGQLTQANVSIQLTEAPFFDPLLGELSAVTPVGAPPPIISPVGANEGDYPDDPAFTPIIHIIREQQDVEVD